ncbi:class C sortase [Pseudoclavibacter sp. CFCC 11306]|uniref:class C sortase n=1 Tax=Pseudoclavibacter sp. CFCC 11306 TaxID=1564493 RepID=UPI001CE48C00|nr:class C sortase [Pseudoclavibacter sp. CFCC 11306]
MTTHRKPRASRTPPQKRRLAWNIVLQTLAMLGIGLLVYPQAATWFARIAQNNQISGYVERVQQTPSAERQRILDAAYAYNNELKPGPLTDPYITENPDEALRTEVYQAYENMLRVSDTDVIGTLSYPKLDIGLPIYHGTADETISKGVGHMYGTSLPVGGPSTHSVLTAHAGLPQSKLLTDLSKAEVGDTFWISVLGEDHHYRVESTETVLPSETESLKITPGEDWVTLFTCTPIGINSHRFMVHAKRLPDGQGDASEELGADGAPLGFPWWAVWFVGGSGVVGWMLFAPPRKKGKKRRDSDADGEDSHSGNDGNESPAGARV